MSYHPTKLPDVDANTMLVRIHEVSESSLNKDEKKIKIGLAFLFGFSFSHDITLD